MKYSLKRMNEYTPCQENVAHTTDGITRWSQNTVTVCSKTEHNFIFNDLYICQGQCTKNISINERICFAPDYSYLLISVCSPRVGLYKKWQIQGKVHIQMQYNKSQYHIPTPWAIKATSTSVVLRFGQEAPLCMLPFPLSYNCNPRIWTSRMFFVIRCLWCLEGLFTLLSHNMSEMAMHAMKSPMFTLCLIVHIVLVLYCYTVILF